MSATDRKWLTRILLKKLNLGIGDKRILDIYHPSAFDLYAQCSHLSDVCKAIESNNIPVAGTSNGGASNGLSSNGLSSNGLIQLFRPLRPMLCERGYISQIQNVTNYFSHSVANLNILVKIIFFKSDACQK